MAHQATNIQSQFQTLGFETADFVMSLGVFMLCMQNLPTFLGARTGFILTFLITGVVFTLWMTFKRYMPPKFLNDAPDYLLEPDFYIVAPDTKAVPLVIDLEKTVEFTKRRRKTRKVNPDVPAPHTN